MASSTLITAYLSEGTHAARPAAPAVPTGGLALYYETDTKNLFFYDLGTTSWISVSSTLAVPTIINSTGTPITIGSPGNTSLQSVLAGANIIEIDGLGGTTAIVGRTANGTPAAPTATTSGQSLFILTGRGYGATMFGTTNTGALTFAATENFSDTAHGTRCVIATTANGSTSAQTALIIGNDTSLTQGASNTFLTAGGSLKVQVSVVASLPSATTEGLGAIRGVSNALSPVIGSPVVTGGAIQCLVMSNGTNWIVA